MKRKIFIIGLTLSAMCLMACGKKEVKIDIGKNQENSDLVSVTISDFENIGKEKWREDITFTNDDDETITVRISATPSLEIDDYKCINAKKYELTPENNEKIIKAVFGSNIVTEYKYSGDFWDFSEDSELESTEGFEGNVYKGYVDDNEVTVILYTFFEDDPTARTGQILIGYSDFFKDMKNVSIVGLNNAVDKEEQFDIISRLFSNCGIIENEKGIFDLDSEFYNNLLEADIEPGTDCFGRFHFLGEDINYGDVLPMQLNHQAIFFFDEDKIMYGEIMAPVTITSIEENVKLLPFEEIKSIIREYFASGNTGNFYANSSKVIPISDLKLVYMDFENDGNISVAPAWELIGADGYSKLYINAITGEI